MRAARNRGHADISVTLRIYAHVIPNMQQVTADVMDGLYAAKEGNSDGV